jgi:hypothetical protein
VCSAPIAGANIKATTRLGAYTPLWTPNLTAASFDPSSFFVSLPVVGSMRWTLLSSPQAAAAWLLLRDLRAPARGVRSLAVHLIIGLLIGTSALFKYQGLMFLAASAGLLGWHAAMGRWYGLHSGRWR